jgi:uncharacterized protein
MLQAVLDTNVFISAMLHPNGVCGQILLFWEQREFLVVYNRELIEEIKIVCEYPRLKSRLKRHRVGALVNQLLEDGVYISANRNSRSSKDPKDDFLIALVEFAQPDALVSSDEVGVLQLEQIGRTRVLNPVQFLQLLQSRAK